MISVIGPRLEKPIKYIVVRQPFQLFECGFLMILQCVFSVKNQGVVSLVSVGMGFSFNLQP